MQVQTFKTTKLRTSRRTKIRGLKYFFLAVPFVLFIVVFSYVPLFGWSFAFFNYKPGLSWANMQFVGFGNFIKIFNEMGEISRVMRNTLAMSALSIICSPIPMIFAILLNEVKSARFKKLIQTTTTLPNFISWIIVYGIAFAMFSNDGPINSILGKVGLPIPEVNILGNNKYVWFFQTGLNIWKGTGWWAIIYIAAISGIDTELYDAAKIDGANKFGQIMHITVPGLANTYLVLLLLGISNMLSNGFDQYFVFYNSLVADKIEVLDYYVYKVGIIINDYSLSIAIGMLKTFISIILLFSANFASKKIRGESLI